jgi:hypothetical protein
MIGDLERGLKRLSRADTVAALAEALALAPAERAAFEAAACRRRSFRFPRPLSPCMRFAARP